MNAVLLVAVGFLYYLHFSGNAPDAESEATKPKPIRITANDLAHIDAAKTPIVFVNTDTLLLHYDYFKKKRDQLETKGARMQADLQGRMKNFENEYLATQQKAQSGALTPAQIDEAQQRLAKKQQDLGSYKEQVSGQLIEEENTINTALNDNIRNYLKEYGKKAGFRYVLGFSSSGGILFANDSLDITPSVLEGLNKAGAVEAPKK